MAVKKNNQIRLATKHQGVYKQLSQKRRNPKDGKLDESFFITFKIIENNKKLKKWVSIGWKSDGVTADQARDVLISIKKQLRTGEPIETILNRFSTGEPIEVVPSGVTIAKPLAFGEAWEIFCAKWLNHLARPDDEKGRYRKHIEPKFAHVPLDQIKSLDLETLKLEIISEGLSAATAKHVLGLFRRVYNKMITWEYYDGRIPTASLQMPKVDNARVRYLTHEEADKLMAALNVRSPFWWRIAMVSLHTGMRLGEVLALTRKDIDFQGDVIFVQRGKTGSRMVQMNGKARAILKDAPVIHPDSPLVFPQQNGELILTQNMGKLFSRVVKDLNFNPKGTPDSQKVVFHTLRHTFASWLVMAGVPLYTVSKLLGHASLDMTYRYAHLAPDVQKEAVNLLDALTDGQSIKGAGGMTAA